MSERICYSCKKKYKSCSCKSCERCDATFQTSLGLVRDRSHCRNCNYAVCLQCYQSADNCKEKICNVCRREQKLAKLQLWHAMSPSPNVRRLSLTGRAPDPSAMAAAAAAMSEEEKQQSLLDAAREGDHHVLMMLLEAGTDINSSDKNGNTALFYAVEHGHVPCVALLMERKADIQVRNNVGWTALHALAWNGHSIECAELLIQMGVDMFARSKDGFTAHSLAVESHQSTELADYLATRQALVAMEGLKSHISGGMEGRLSDQGSIPSELCTYMVVLLEHCEQHKEILFNTTTEKEPNIRLPQKPAEAPVCISIQDCGSSTIFVLQAVETGVATSLPGPGKNNYQGGAIGQNNMPEDGIIDETESGSPTITGAGVRKRTDERSLVLQLQQQLAALQAQNEELEEKCQILIENVANANAERHKEREKLEKEFRSAVSEKEATLQMMEAKYQNRIAKTEADTRLVLEKTRWQLEEADTAKDDLLALQQSLKLTWVPDRFVRHCANAKCRKTFTQTRRRHHCRCCGRVFCRTCTSQKAQILSFGYTRPVRVCQACYALLDDLVSQTAIRERPPGESDESEFEDLSIEVAQTFGIEDASQQQ